MSVPGEPNGAEAGIDAGAVWVAGDAGLVSAAKMPTADPVITVVIHVTINLAR
jgi:hypothetical protein